MLKWVVGKTWGWTHVVNSYGQSVYNEFLWCGIYSHVLYYVWSQDCDFIQYLKQNRQLWRRMIFLYNQLYLSFFKWMFPICHLYSSMNLAIAVFHPVRLWDMLKDNSYKYVRSNNSSQQCNSNKAAVIYRPSTLNTPISFRNVVNIWDFMLALHSILLFCKIYPKRNNYIFSWKQFSMFLWW